MTARGGLSMNGDDGTTIVDANSWHSPGKAPLVGAEFSLLYMGTSKWRPVRFTSQPDDIGSNHCHPVDQGR